MTRPALWDNQLIPLLKPTRFSPQSAVTEKWPSSWILARHPQFDLDRVDNSSEKKGKGPYNQEEKFIGCPFQ